MLILFMGNIWACKVAIFCNTLTSKKRDPKLWKHLTTKKFPDQEYSIALPPQMENQKREITEKALELFHRYGIRSITMDDLAAALSVSKKTLYKHFENKADLVHHCGQLLYQHIQDSLMTVMENSESAIDELFEVDQVVWKMMEKHNPSMRYQIEKYYPKTFNYLFEGRAEMIRKMVAANIERGKRDGCYRLDADTGVVSHLYCSKIKSIPEGEPKISDHHSLRYISRQALIYHIRGLATPQGLAKLEEKLKTYTIDEN